MGRTKAKKAARRKATPTARYIATFDSQAWIRDEAVSVDPRGATTWDCTAFVLSQNLEAKIMDCIKEVGHFLDLDDVLKEDPAAPGWVRDWDGPFTITVQAQP